MWASGVLLLRAALCRVQLTRLAWRCRAGLLPCTIWHARAPMQLQAAALQHCRQHQLCWCKCWQPKHVSKRWFGHITHI